MSKRQSYYSIDGFDGQYTEELKDLYNCLTAGIPERIQYVKEHNESRQDLFMSLLALRSKLAKERANHISLDELESAWHEYTLEHFRQLLEKMDLAPMYEGDLQYILHCMRVNDWTLEKIYKVHEQENGMKIECMMGIPYKCFAM